MSSNQNRIKKIRLAILCFVAIGIAFFWLTYFANTVLSAYDVTGVRASAAFNPIFGIAFGWPAILACAVANFISDLASGWGMSVALLGVIPQLLYGAIPYYVWKHFNPSYSTRTRLDSPKKTVMFALLMVVNSVLIGISVGFIQNFVSGDDFWDTALFAFLNDLDMCLVLGLPMMAIIDFVYSKVLHKGKRKLSVNEKIILLISAVDVIVFAIVIIIDSIRNAGAPREVLWRGIFAQTITIVNISLICSVAIMYIYHYYKIKNAGLRIFEKKNGTIYTDEEKRLEFLSYSGRAVESRIITNSSDKEGINNKTHPSYEDSWCTMLSVQKGCPMKCTYCDVHDYGFFGNVTREEFSYQIKTILETSGSTHTKLFEVNFMRMGEPTYNQDLLDYIEFDLQNEISDAVNADEIVPAISTMLPKFGKNTLNYLREYCRIKNEVYNGNAILQLSINSTDDNQRDKIFGNRSLSLEEISKIANELPVPKGLKYQLNFAIPQQPVIDPKRIDELFDKEKFCIKMTPVHHTFNSTDNGYEIADVYEKFDIFWNLEEQFKALGWDVLIYMDRKEEDDDLLTCGNLLLTNISDKVKLLDRQKKVIGLVVAIEMDAIFNYYKNCKELEAPEGYRLFLVEREKYDIYIIQAGMGEIYAAGAVQYLITHCGVSKIFNYGVVGGMTDEMKKCKVCLVDRVVHYKYDISEMVEAKIGQVEGHNSIFLLPDPNMVKSALSVDGDLKLVTCCSGDKFIGTAEEKAYLHNTFEGDICDMESAGIVMTCEQNRIPCILLKAVADGLQDGAEGFYKELFNASIKCLEVTDKVIEKLALLE